MDTLKQFGDKHVSMDTLGQQYNTTIYNINFELGHTTAIDIRRLPIWPIVHNPDD
jgi:hypothetical protein